jgi:phage-related protein
MTPPPGPSAGEVGVDVVPDLKSFGRDLKRQIEPAIESATRGIDGIGSKISRGLASGFKSVVKVGAAAFAGLTVAAAAQGAIAVDAYIEAAQVAAQTNAAIKSTGAVANVTEKDVASLATTIRDYSGISDEAVQSAENVLLTFTKVRNEVGAGNNIFSQATVAIADMSARLGKNLSGTAIQVGKALNDPIKGVTALGRAGVQFTEQQKEQIATLVEAGDIMGAQKIILAELTTQFGGSAKAMGKANPAAILKDQMGDVQETIGAAILPIVSSLAKTFKPLLEDIGPILAGFIEDLAPLFRVLGKAIGPVVKVLADAFEPILAALVPVLADMSPFLLDLVKALAELLVALTPLIPPLGRLIVAMLPLLTLVVKAATALTDILVPALTAIIGVVASVYEAVVRFVTNWSGAWEKVKDIAFAIWNGIVDFFKGLPGRIWDALSSLPGLLGDLAVKAGQWFLDAFTNSPIVQWFRDLPARIWDAAKALPGLLKDLAVQAWNWFLNAFKQSPIVQWFRDLPGNIVEALGDLGSLLFEAGKTIIRGLLNGLKAAAGEVLDFMGGLAGEIAQHKGPLEKDRKLLVPQGRAIMEGLEVGLRSQFGSLRATLAEASDLIAIPSGSLRPVAIGARPNVDTMAAGLAPTGTEGAGPGVVHLEFHEPTNWTPDKVVDRERWEVRKIRRR